MLTSSLQERSMYLLLLVVNYKKEVALKIKATSFHWLFNRLFYLTSLRLVHYQKESTKSLEKIWQLPLWGG